MLTGTYVDRDTPLHRAPAGLKLVVLLVLSVGLLTVRDPITGGVAVVVVTGLYALGRVGPRTAWAQVRPLRWFVPVVFTVQWLVLGLDAAVGLSTRIVVLVALAGLVTLTTRTSALMAAVERALTPLRLVGVDPARIALVLSLTVRSIPVLAALAGRVREAQRARGCERDVRAFAVPLVVGALRQADALGEALQARGLDD
ncbi:energy-coupling factor transporter transmembrane component T family protein [Cellulomonas bogoriensis]|uniref:Cobalt ABC transporter permease n=1 Tax=Cellulomonas bogoriensis 69B4 = DSM 16987 TaxID=1386082 RepID=A0A0A0BM72_9CELL|nr:energy-coupling factor transporter transmembrane protein EcfT [Cellulomonas bogoriensis]KGM08762.1 cobalt ABC transporter permease [Cellulomonas bogoriensis 69B4 = DSM 16987]